jgi:hypothetical protein
MTRIIAFFGRLLLAVALTAGCSGESPPPPEPARHEHETWEQYIAAYDLERRRIESRSTLVQGVKKARRVLGPELAVDDQLALEAFKSSEHPHQGPVPIRSAKTMAPAAVERAAETLAKWQPAFQAVRQARYRPWGLLPIDANAEFDSLTRHHRDCRKLARGLQHAAVVDLRRDRPRKAYQRARSILSVEESLYRTPAIATQLVRFHVAETANETYLLTAASAEWRADELDRMVTFLLERVPDPRKVLLRSLQLERALILFNLRRLERGDEALMQETLRTLDSLGQLGRLGPSAESTESADRERIAATLRRRLPDERKAVAEFYRHLTHKFDRPVERIGPLPVEEAGLFVRGIQPVWVRMQTELYTSIALRRAAIALLRAQAFRVRNQRLPRPAEVRLPQDPFHPGRPLTFEVDEGGAVSVYATAWPSAEGEGAAPRKVGYRLEDAAAKNGRAAATQ